MIKYTNISNLFRVVSRYLLTSPSKLYLPSESGISFGANSPHGCERTKLIPDDALDFVKCHISKQMIKGKKLYLVFHGRFPSEKAASLFAAKSSEAFTNVGLATTLLVPRRIDRSREEYSKYYGIKKNFHIKFLAVIDTFSVPFLKKIAFTLSLVSFSISSFLYLLFHAQKNSVIYSNETLPLILASFVFPYTVYEMHDFPEKKDWFYKFLFRRVWKVVSTNKWKREKLIEKFNLPVEKIFYEPNAVDLEKFHNVDSREESRRKLSLPLNKTLVGYVGMLKTMNMAKGVDTALEAVYNLDESFRLVLIGGNQDDINYYKKKAEEMGIFEKVIFAGWIENSLIPEYLTAMDIVIAPFPGNDHYNFYMSPMKLFEYMASSRPIIATNLVSIREILDNNRSALLVPPEDPTALLEAILKIKNNPELGHRLTSMAYERVTDHTWEKRAKRILNFIKTA